MRKMYTEQVASKLTNCKPFAIPEDLRNRKTECNIKDIYFLNKDLSDVGVYGNCIVVFNDGTYLDLDSVNDIEFVFSCI